MIAPVLKYLVARQNIHISSNFLEHPKNNSIYRSSGTIPLWKETKNSNPELPGIINTEVDRKQSNVEMLVMQLAYDYAIHHGGSYDVQQHVISQKHHRNARQSIRAGTDRSLQHRPVVQDTKQMHLWCVIRFSFTCTYCRSKHWHKRWKIAGSVLSAGFFDQRLHFFFKSISLVCLSALTGSTNLYMHCLSVPINSGES